MPRQDFSAGSESHLVYEWNRHSAAENGNLRRVELVDETLRDGLQSPSVVSPSLDDRMQLVRYMVALGIDVVNIGLPGAGEQHYRTALNLASLVLAEKLPIRMSAAARTVVADIVPIARLSQALGAPVTVYAFIGTSPIRQVVEDWSLKSILSRAGEAVRFAVGEGLETVFVMEDTTRTPPETLRPIYRAGIEAGASGLCLCDTVGYSNPAGTDALIQFTREVIGELGRPVTIDFHGHNDRGLATINALQAARSGADRIHGCAVGIGERVGNCAMEQLLINLELEGHGRRDLRALYDYARLASKMMRYKIPVSAPIVGRDAFRTGTGVHAAAIVKAQDKGDAWLADRVYSAVPASLIGRKQRVEVGNMSGKSNVRHWLKSHRIRPTETLVDEVLALAKNGDRLLSPRDIEAVLAKHRQKQG